MKKTMTMMLAAVMLLSAGIMLSACGGAGSLAGDIVDEKTMNIAADNCSEDDSLVSAALTVTEGEKLVIESALESGAMELDLIPGAEDQNADELPDYDDVEGTYEIEVSGTGTQEVEVAPGSYSVKVTCEEDKTTGTVTVTVE